MDNKPITYNCSYCKQICISIGSSFKIDESISVICLKCLDNKYLLSNDNTTKSIYINCKNCGVTNRLLEQFLLNHKKNNTEPCCLNCNEKLKDINISENEIQNLKLEIEQLKIRLMKMENSYLKDQNEILKLVKEKMEIMFDFK